MEPSAMTKREAGEGGGRPIHYGALDDRLGFILRRAQNAIFRDVFRANAMHAISPAQYSVLTIIENNPGLSQTRVADALGIKKTNFVPLIRELERRGLACRTRIPNDRRSFALSLTTAGASLLACLHAETAAHEARIRVAIGDAACEALHASLRRIVTELTPASGDGARR